MGNEKFTPYFFAFSCLVSIGQRTIVVQKTGSINVDGKLDENDWLKSSWTSEFTQMKPFPSRSLHQNKLWFQWSMTKEAIYFGVKCFDDPDSISRVLSIRDDYNPNLDVFGIFIDTYKDNQNGFFFGITSRGVQLDAKIFNQDFNNLLNLVCSKTNFTDEGWVAEINPLLCYSFSKNKIQSWNINFARQISRYRESTWNPVNPDLENYLLESGKTLGIQNITPPLRLAFIPFLSSYVTSSKYTPTISSFNGGMDIKYGINEALTLDVTLLPDFGQVVFDNQVLNVSPFEIEFNENDNFLLKVLSYLQNLDCFTV